MAEKPDKDFIPSVGFVRAFQRFVGEVFRLNGQLLATADMLSKDLDITAGRWQAIAIIQEEPMTVAAMSRRLGLSRQSVQQTANRLAKQNMIEFAPNPNHRTSPLVKLTDHGLKVMDILRDRQVRVTANFTGGLGYSIEDIDRLTQELGHLRQRAHEFDALEILDNEQEP